MIIHQHNPRRWSGTNGGGKYRRVWRLYADGSLLRLSQHGKFQPRYRREQIPVSIIAAAAAAGVTIQPARDEKGKP